jgi:hypothetical protein
MKLALASVVTEALLPEFLLLRYSWELFHGPAGPWYVRCDAKTAHALGDLPHIATRTVLAPGPRRVTGAAGEPFREIVANKCEVIDDAWKDPDIDSVLFLDADIVMTSHILDVLAKVDADVALAPNYYPREHNVLVPVHGYFNSGVVFARSPRFHRLWRRALHAAPWKFTDQACLNDVSERCRVYQLGPEINVGFWRSPQYGAFVYEPIPSECKCLHGHMFQPLNGRRGWIDRCFALHCLQAFKRDGRAEWWKLADEIIARDANGWYRASLALQSA